jgi:hypothetical protein
MPHGFYFCTNPKCLNGLHVRAGDPGVEGDGNWAELPNGVIVGRRIVNDIYLCDGCGRALVSGTLGLESAPRV